MRFGSSLSTVFKFMLNKKQIGEEEGAHMVNLGLGRALWSTTMPPHTFQSCPTKALAPTLAAAAEMRKSERRRYPRQH